MANINFFTLPAELRNAIYALVFTGQQDRPRYPWEALQNTSPLSLFLSCRQMHSEASSLFWHEHAANTAVQFSSSNQLRNFIDEYPLRWPQFGSASFRLRILALDQNDLSAAVEELIAAQKLLEFLPHNWYSSSIKNWDFENGKRLWNHLFYSGTHHCDVEDICSEAASGYITSRTSYPELRGGTGMSCCTWSQRARAEREISPPSYGSDDSDYAPRMDGEKSQRKVTSECMIIQGSVQDIRCAAESAP